MSFMQDKFFIFKKKICVPIEQSMVAKYVNSVGPFTDRTAEYLAVTSGCNEDSSLEELQKGICDGIKEECEVYDRREEIVAKAIEKGLICRDRCKEHSSSNWLSPV